MADKKISALTAATTPVAGTEVLPIVQSSATVKVSIDNMFVGRTVNFRYDQASSGSAYSAPLQLTNGTNWGYGVGLDLAQAASSGGPIVTTGAVVSDFDSGTSFSLRFHAMQTGTLKEIFRATPAGNIKPVVAGTGLDLSVNTPAAGMTSQLLNWYEEGTWSVGVEGSTTAGTYNGLVNYATYTRIGRQVTANFYVSWDTGTGTGNLLITGLPFTSRNASGYYYSGSVSNTNAAYTSGNTVSLFLAHNSTKIELVQISGTAGQSSVPYDADALVIGQITYFV